MITPGLAGVVWVKSPYSSNNGACVEVGLLDGGDIAVRDSKDPDGPALRFTAAEWDAFQPPGRHHLGPITSPTREKADLWTR
ncbi:DUF397 domain-containing protein [Microbispora sp. H10885]|uniref:DUF397 domain-containing protein n=1 Tax=Microbispora sp. H10885 TaxID=2729110 RepID=UPI0016022B65|nr:DUF397 domain-containing protein [Microbispora sp. H10885]